MNSTQVATLITTQAGYYGLALLGILGAIIGIGIGYLVFKIGVKKIQGITYDEMHEKIKKDNQRAYTQIRNGEFLDAGDKIQTSTRW